MTSIIMCALICFTVIFCVVFIVHKGGIPIVIERREMEWVPSPESHLGQQAEVPIGFKDTTEDNKPEDSTEEKTLSDKEEMEQTLKDVASTVSALFRGEVDIDELN